MQQSIATAKNELVKMIPAGKKEKEALKKLQILWMKVATRQKHIQLADCSNYGWCTVKCYEANLLASDSDDEKSIKKAEKEAQREVEE